MGEPADSVQPSPPVRAGTWVYMEKIELQAFIEESRKFQSAVSLDLFAVKGELKVISGRLDKINGSVGRHDADIRAIQDQRIADNAAKQAMDTAKEVFRKRYQPYIERATSAIAGAAVIYALTHGTELAKLFAGK